MTEEASSKISYLPSQHSEKISEGLESIVKTFSIGNDEELWVLMQFYIDLRHVDEAREKIMQDKTVGEFIKELDNLVT
jgi:plasmid maintenance system antidote protein VapI